MKRQFWGAERKLIASEFNKSIDSGLDVFLWADFNASHQMGVRLNCYGTLNDLRQQGIELEEGMKLILWDEDQDDSNNQAVLFVEATARFIPEDDLWVGEFEWDRIRRSSGLQ